MSARARGFSLVAALFLIVVVAALGAVAMRAVVSHQHVTHLALLGARALEAARTGIEWGGYRALGGGACVSGTLNLSEGALAGFTVEVACSATSHTEAGSPVTIYTLTSLARSGTYGTPDYVSRRVRARITDAT